MRNDVKRITYAWRRTHVTVLRVEYVTATRENISREARGYNLNLRRVTFASLRFKIVTYDFSCKFNRACNI